MKTTARSIFEGLSGSYDAVLRYATLLQDDYWKRWLVSASSIKPNHTVLDLACGTTVLERFLWTKGCSIIGVDLTEEMLRVAQARQPATSEALLVGDAESLPFNDNQFDLVFSCYLAKYAKLDRLSSEVYRILKPGGRLNLYDFSRPRGRFGILYSLYLLFLLAIGKAMRRSETGISFTFRKLPKILSKTTWDDEMEGVLLRQRFVRVGWKKLTRGVVTAFWASK
jgi:ubiquinone/menaquinone biosynthesis C-methylase UbiE